MSVLTLDVLPAGNGDCLWIEYGNPASPRRILIDGGAKGTYKRALQSRFARGEGELELLVITHVDSDHITGILELIEGAHRSIKPKDVWFNGFRHLPNEDPETLGPVQGERLTDHLVNQRMPWNIAFDRKAVVVPDQGELPRRELSGGLTLTLLSPTVQALASLRPVWEKEVRKAGLDPNMAAAQDVAAEEGFELLESGPLDVEALAAAPFVEDSSEPNGSSIAMLLEFEGQRVLLSADAHPRVLASAIKRHNGDQRLKLTACKIPHHGSKANVSRQLLDRLDCNTYIFSTNGAHFRHPDREGVARVVKWGGTVPKLIFNYQTPFTEVWKPRFLKEEFHYDAAFPEVAPSTGIVLSFP
jgi:beta-lactamase superfamily II metal-dependent hydrolase